MFTERQKGQNDWKENWGKQEKEIRIDGCWGLILKKT